VTKGPASRRGFTIIEVMVVVAIMGVLAALAAAAFGRQKPRQQLDQAALELRALMFGARQTALSTGQPVVLMIFPNQLTGKGRGRLVLYRDGDFAFFTAAGAPNFASFIPQAQPTGPRSEVMEVLDLESGVTIGPPAGMGPAAVMPAPYDDIPINTACAFCTGALGRGAIAFQPDGSVDFHAGIGPAIGTLPQGASLSLTQADAAETDGSRAATYFVNGVRTIVIASANGSMQTLKWQPTP
jgi:prepilin-type N-terminal cleavage/methylation domain-containing protein